MKKITLFLALFLSGFVFKNASAQIPATVKVNIVSQPLWGPVGYDHVEYYYMPGIDAFYSVPKKQYIYLQNGRWMFTPALPVRMRNYDLYSGYKVVINDPTPYRNAGMYRIKYASYKGKKDQKIIRNSSESKYFVIKNHPNNKNLKIISNSNASKNSVIKNNPANNKGKKSGNKQKQ